ncbi:uncharacterized protein MELLADRAFT_63875 [Melampsora larici-populina 98AG31]|uniref:Uncharacterized protein n=1 Tax=Melampsora larici-populina (strain 98AG31 / pathotype 3-4-7) TaxID=747676 RepID=F4RNU6_MELLP|nr:uncharacterized protein MELLADRAFT_63875 [Melampsora larici-populina 98AG31]EGG05806.1 hypothetical protein MELLADRAFT_63875 [Melampsora larici-populina 98AG31]
MVNRRLPMFALYFSESHFLSLGYFTDMYPFEHQHSPTKNRIHNILSPLGKYALAATRPCCLTVWAEIVIALTSYSKVMLDSIFDNTPSSPLKQPLMHLNGTSPAKHKTENAHVNGKQCSHLAQYHTKC